MPQTDFNARLQRIESKSSRPARAQASATQAKSFRREKPKKKRTGRMIFGTVLVLLSAPLVKFANDNYDIALSTDDSTLATIIAGAAALGLVLLLLGALTFLSSFLPGKAR